MKTACQLVLSAMLLVPAICLAVETIDVTNSNENNNVFHQSGWVPKELIEDQMLKQAVPRVCRGNYFEFANQFETQPDHLYITGDSASFDPSGKITLEGRVHSYINDSQLFADRASVDRQSGIITAEGRVRLYYQGLHFFGDSYWINSNTGEMRMNDLGFIATATRQAFEISVLTRDEFGVFHIEKGSYSTCEPEDRSWRVYGSDITLDYDQGWGTVVHAILYVDETPVFYFPWFRFPLDDRRHSGLLLPDIVAVGDWYYHQPVYLNLAPSLDATLYPRYYGKRGLLLDTETRLLTRYTENVALASGINDGQTESWRGRRGLYHTGGFGLPFQTRIDYTQVSDPLYYHDLNFSILGDSSDFINQNAEISASYANMNFRVGSYDIQPIGDETTTGYARLPEAEIYFNNRFGLYLIDAFSIYSEYEPRRHTPFTTSEITEGEMVSARRRHDQASFGLLFEQSYGFARGQLYFYNTSYQQQDQRAGIEEKLNRQTQAATVDLGLFLDRLVNFDQVTYVQTLEPRLFLVSSPYIDQNDYPVFGTTQPRFIFDSLFQANRFSGYDRIGDARDVSFSVTSRLKDDKGYEFFRIGAGVFLYGENRRVTLESDDNQFLDTLAFTRDLSPVASQIQITVNDTMNLSSDYVFDQERGKSLFNRWNFQHKVNSRTVYNMGYNYVVEQFTDHVESEEAYISGVVQLTTPTALFGRYYYDIEESITEELLAGVEYESCCWRVRVGGFREQESYGEETVESGLFLQFHFKGLTGSSVAMEDSYSSNLDSALAKAIPGFANRSLYLPD